MQDCWLIDAEEYISRDAVENTSVKLFPEGSVLMAIYASPTLGRLGILAHEAVFNQAALAFIPSKIISKEWLYCKLFELRDEFNAIARGAGQQNISGKIVKEYEVVLPSLSLVEAFTNIANSMFDQRLILQRAISSLQEARNRLLPKLMSGEIEVS